MTPPVTACSAWQQLTSLAGQEVDPRTLMDEARVRRYTLSTGGLTADFSRHRITDTILEALLELASETGVADLASSMVRGDAINTTEDRAVLHTAMRADFDQDETALDDALVQRIRQERQRIRDVSTAIRSGDWCGVTGKPFTDVINIGIGGSDLGPKMIVEGLREFADGPRCHFISNVDGAEIGSLLPTLDAETTLIIISSKTFTTIETMTNANTALAWLGESLGTETPQSTTHCIGVTNNIEGATAFGVPESQLLTFIDAVGGRYSLWSSIGLSIAVAVGSAGFDELLAGARHMDQHFLTADPTQNLPLVMALTGIWYNNFLGIRNMAVIPYCQRLGSVVDHLQQLDMESNGKSATKSGEEVTVATGPVIWGQTGTNGQHAFFQLLHQGTQVIPVDFIGVVNDGLSQPTHHRILMANMVAQAEALMTGRGNDDPHRRYPGNRPSTTLLIDELTPATLGQLIALYEHKVFVQGAIWGINSFDQWGVELGKVIAGELLTGDTSQRDAASRALMKRVGLTD